MDLLINDCDTNVNVDSPSFYDMLGDIGNQNHNDFTLTNDVIFSNSSQSVQPQSSDSQVDPVSFNNFVLDEWNPITNTTANNNDISSQIDFSNVVYMPNNGSHQGLDSNKGTKMFVHSDNDSDSGICSSSNNSEHSPKATTLSHSTLDDSSQSYTQVLSSAASSVIELDNQDLVDQIINSDQIGFNHFNVDNVTFAAQPQTDTANTEELLNNIEQMLKSMDNNSDQQKQPNNKVKSQNQNTNKTTRNSSQVKKEPNNETVKKISPKILPKPSAQRTELAGVSNMAANNLNSPPVQHNNNNNNNNNTDNVIRVPLIIHASTNSNFLSTPILIHNLNQFNGNVQSRDCGNPVGKKLKKSDIHYEIMSPQNTNLILSPMVSNLVAPASPNLSSVKNDSTSASNSPIELDPSLAKKQSRMIKNRESACLSRKRKKEYVTTLEDSLNEAKKENDGLKQENQKLKDKVLVLETENKLLKDQQKLVYQHQNTVKVMDLTKQNSGLITLKTMPLNNRNSLKRPFVMMAIFFVFGLNIFQFINIDSITNTGLINNQNQQESLISQKSIDYTLSQKAAAVSAAAVSNGALVDPKRPFQFKSRHLIADYDYPEGAESSNEIQKNSSLNDFNLTKSGNDSNMDLVLINGTWHMIDLDLCYKVMSVGGNESEKFYNHTHFNKINSELNNWFERHIKILKNVNSQDGSQENFAKSLWREFMNEKQKKLRKMTRNVSASDRSPSSRFRSPGRRHLQAKKSMVTKDYPVSVYDVQLRLYENFARTVRTHDDTFYYVSFRRDHVIFPAINQNTTNRPKLSLVIPASMNNQKVNDKSGSLPQLQFMQIDCEIVDTKLFSIHPDEMPYDYMKIINQDDEAFKEPYSY